jgi:mRNA-degrading endonuclease RelE of RelBE toxin-antitoxin system
MTYRIIYAPSFLADVRNQIAYMVDEAVSPATIGHWFSGLYQRLDNLDDMPKRYPVDPVQTSMAGRETRKMTFGDYLVFYQIDDAGKRVDLVAFMHSAKRREAPK